MNTKPKGQASKQGKKQANGNLVPRVSHLSGRWETLGTRLGKRACKQAGKQARGGLPSERGEEARRLFQGCKLRILISLRVFKTEHQCF